MNLVSSVLRGAVGFAVVSAAAFAVWAYGARWFASIGGEKAMYAGCTLVFLAATGWLLHPLVNGAGSYGRFNRMFFPAFFAYALVWSVAWFALGFGPGEWIGSAAGSLAFVLVCGCFLGGWRQVPVAALVLFASHSAGYFLGGEVYYPSDHGPLMKLAWGLIYGLGFGAGLGFVLWSLQRGATTKV